MKRTVLIIGAGASNALHPEFALGRELLQQISDRLTDRTSVHAPYLSALLDEKLDFGYSTRWDFVHHIDQYAQHAEFPSIDGFLDEVSSYPEFKSVKDVFIDIGKCSIMFHILGYEGIIKDYRTEDFKENAWIDEIAKFIDEKDLLSNTNPNNFDLKIITFNYDRTIEHFLYNHPKFEDKKDKIKSFVGNSLIHVYGKVGGLEWQNDNKYFEFGEDNNKIEKIFDERNAIDTMYSERIEKNEAEIKKASSWIHSKETKKVCAFGFNFDLINYSLLSLQNLRIVVPELKFIANVYPHVNARFTNRRIMANRIRKVKHDAEITYLGCTDFLKYTLNDV